ncbi:MAG: hypothetical protein ACFFAN_11830 [Promethearchaeota archaeon]
MTEEYLIKKVKDSILLIVIALIAVLVTLIFLTLVTSPYILVAPIFLALLISLGIMFVFLTFFWKSIVSRRSDENAIIEVITKYITRVKPCKYITLISMVSVVFLTIFWLLLPITDFYRYVLTLIFLPLGILSLLLYVLGEFLETVVNKIRDPILIEKDIFREKLRNHLKESWKNNHNPTLEELKSTLNLLSAHQISLLYDILCEFYTKTYIDCVYNEKNRVYYTKKSSVLIWIVLSVILLSWMVLFVLIFMYPDLASRTLWRAILLFSNLLLLALLFAKKSNKKKREEIFSQMHPEYVKY